MISDTFPGWLERLGNEEMKWVKKICFYITAIVLIIVKQWERLVQARQFWVEEYIFLNKVNEWKLNNDKSDNMWLVISVQFYQNWQNFWNLLPVGDKLVDINILYL